MMAAPPAKLGSEADAGRSKAQHVLILAVCSKIAGITRSASPTTALDPRLGAKTRLNDGILAANLTGDVPNGECRLKQSPRDRRAKNRNSSEALLKGLIFTDMGTAMTPTYTRKGERL